MTDLRSPSLIYAKGFLFLVTGAAAAGLLIGQNPTLRTVVLLAIAVWSFARAYYFAFYVIERYVDPSFRFSGLGSFVGYLVRRSHARPRAEDQDARDGGKQN
jgi:hypothetical protein